MCSGLSSTRRNGACPKIRTWREDNYSAGAILKMPNNQAVRDALSSAFATSPTRQSDRLPLHSGWFDKAAPTLTRLVGEASDVPFVEAYFQTFTFSAGQQQQVLEFLRQFLMRTSVDSQRAESFKRVADNVLISSSPAEARWLYDRTLELVRSQQGAAPTKDLALFVGRHAYSAARPARRPTVYDEQAIANDIAVQLQ